MIPFVKAHAYGNDFLIVDAAAVPQPQHSAAAVALCARNTGVGADGVEFILAEGDQGASIRLYNADGSVAEISGNGTRCVAAWLAVRRGLEPGTTLHLFTDAGERTCTILAREQHRVRIVTGMGVPVMESCELPLPGIAVNVGNPHFVLFPERQDFSMAGRPWQEVGREICFHPAFPQQTNVEFVRRVNAEEIEIRIFERGVGPTTSSGTGTSASAAAFLGRFGGAHLRVRAPGGEQTVEWAGEGSELMLTGTAELISSGEAYL